VAQVTATVHLIERAEGVIGGIACLHADLHPPVQRPASRFPLIALSGHLEAGEKA